MALWDDILTPRDKEVFALSGFGKRAGFGQRPAILVIDVNYNFVGDKPEPILQSVKRFRTSCGEEGWEGVYRIRELLAGRMLIAAAFPWMSIAIWFIPIALGFELGSYELPYSIVLTILGLYFAFRLDEGLENIEFRPALKWFIWLAFIAAFITYTGFSFHVPNNFFQVLE